MNVRYYKPLLPTMLLLLFITAANAQQLKAIDNLSNKINWYGKKIQTPVLFVHFDKTVCSTSEQVWFTAYLLNTYDNKKYNTLSVALIDNDYRTVMQNDKFIMKNGRSFGTLAMPDSISPGHYTFIAYTNRLKNGQPDDVFMQPITIKSDDQPTFTASLNPLDTAASKAEQKVLLLVNVPDLDKKPPPQIAFRYYVGSIAHPLMQGKAQTSATYKFNIPSGLLVPGNNLLHVQLSYKGDTREISMALPVKASPALVRFFPEGGSLVNNLPCTVGLEVRTAAGQPLGASAFLYDDNKLADTVQTSSYGLGRFSFTPMAGHSYSLKLYKVNTKDTSYLLPQSLTEGSALTVEDAVANDTLTVIIKDTQQEKLYLIGHNYREVFFVQPVDMANGMKRLRLVISALPKGLAGLTLTDSLGRPFAERLFFAHYNRREPVNITTDKNEYATRQKVNVKINLHSIVPDSGFVSVACVQENRVPASNKNDIESYFYLEHDLGELPVRETYLTGSEADKQFLENILLIKGWSRYTWRDMLKTQPADTLHQFSDPVFTGNVTLYKDKLRDPVQIINQGHPFHMINTDKTGNFVLKYDDLVTEPGKPTTLLIPRDQGPNYHIHISDPYTKINEQFAAQLPINSNLYLGQENTSYLQIADNESAIHLKAVTIKDKDDDSFYGTEGNSHQDYGYITLTPMDHHGKPIRGKELKFVFRGKLKKGDNPLEFKGIYAAQEFYPLSDTVINDPEPQYLSTLYWKHLLPVSSRKDIELSFYTGDITGRFKIVVQGVTGKDVTYGEATFNVVKPK